MLLSKQVYWKILIIKITIKSWPALSVPNSANLVKDKLKNVKANIYKNLITSWILSETISFNKIPHSQNVGYVSLVYTKKINMKHIGGNIKVNNLLNDNEKKELLKLSRNILNYIAVLITFLLSL